MLSKEVEIENSMLKIENSMLMAHLLPAVSATAQASSSPQRPLLPGQLQKTKQLFRVPTPFGLFSSRKVLALGARGAFSS